MKSPIWKTLHGLALPHSLTFPTHCLCSFVLGLPSSALRLPPTCAWVLSQLVVSLGLIQRCSISLESGSPVQPLSHRLFEPLPNTALQHSCRSCSESAFSVLSCFTSVNLKNLHYFNFLSSLCVFGSSAFFSLRKRSLFKLSTLCISMQWFLITK